MVKNASSMEKTLVGNEIPAWRPKIDWLSISTPSLYHAFTEQDHDNASIDIITHLLTAFLGCRQAFSELTARATLGAGRTFHPRGVRYDVGIVVFYGGQHAPPLIEISGSGCDYLSTLVDLRALAARECENVSRIDLAADLRCECSPDEFVTAGISARHTTRASHKSETGCTEYIGSPHSDRRCRVYRYAPPHPRADSLRIEVVLRRDLAKQAAAHLETNSIGQAWRAAADVYQFSHPYWRMTENDGTALKTLKNEKTSAGRLRWLVKVCIPALRDALKDELISREHLSELISQATGQSATDHSDQLQ